MLKHNIEENSLLKYPNPKGEDQYSLHAQNYMAVKYLKIIIYYNLLYYYSYVYCHNKVDV